MRKYAIFAGIILSTLSFTSSARYIGPTTSLDSGTGDVSFSFASLDYNSPEYMGEYMGRTIRTDPENYDPNQPELYGQATPAMYGGAASYQWGAWDSYGDGGSQYTWSNNILGIYEGSFQNIQKGEKFVAGILHYHNGIAYIGTSPDGVILNITTNSTTPDFNQYLPLNIKIVSTPNDDTNGNPLPTALAADYIYFPDYPEFGSLRVAEGKSGEVELLLSFNSLHFEGFGEVSSMESSDAFWSPSITTLTAVPVPGSVLFFTSSLIMLGHIRKKSKI